MRLRVEAGVALGILVVLILVLAASAIALLERMSPAVGRILSENVASEEAVEDMLAVLAVSPVDEAGSAAFHRAYDRARHNVTEAEEPEQLARIGAGADAALRGDPAARADVVRALQALGDVNRASMARADSDAQHLGSAGAWATAALGSMGLALGVLVFRRLRMRLELPAEDLAGTLAAVRAGDPHRRCATLPAPLELRQIGADLNWLLDARFTTTAAPDPLTADLRRVLALLLDEAPGPEVLLTAAGGVLAVSRDALDLDVSALAAGPLPPGWTVSDVPGTSLRRLRGPARSRGGGPAPA